MIKYTGYEIIDKMLKDNNSLLVYGEAATGKTSLLLHIVKTISMNGLNALFISTEGSLYQARVSLEPENYSNVLFTEIYSLDELLEYILLYVPLLHKLRYIVIDSINALYRLSSWEEGSIEKFGLINALLKKLVNKRNGLLFASAQVRAVDDSSEVIASGMSILEYWFDIIIQLRRENGRRVLKIIKPRGYERELIEFKITSKGIEWIEY
ncbi:MAG: AAA family ATPase [Thermoprotei archaeon]|nr:MAG: AAA family ATPase [Thermoprotei archaeon]